jgi:hypothetical protein
MMRAIGKKYLDLLTGKSYRQASQVTKEAVTQGNKAVAAARKQARDHRNLASRTKEELARRRKDGYKGTKKRHPATTQGRFGYHRDNLDLSKRVKQLKKKAKASVKGLKDQRNTRRKDVAQARTTQSSEGQKTALTIGGTVAVPALAAKKYGESKERKNYRNYRYSAISELMEFDDKQGSVKIDRGTLTKYRKQQIQLLKMKKALTSNKLALGMGLGTLLGVGGTVGAQKLMGKKK